jgi:hypothetical protein
MARQRKSLTFNPDILERAEVLMRARCFDELSEFISALVREEYERRQPPHLADAIAPTPAPPAVQPVTYRSAARYRRRA